MTEPLAFAPARNANRYFHSEQHENWLLILSTTKGQFRNITTPAITLRRSLSIAQLSDDPREREETVAGMLLCSTVDLSLRLSHSTLGIPVRIQTPDLSQTWTTIHQELMSLRKLERNARVRTVSLDTTCCHQFRDLVKGQVTFYCQTYSGRRTVNNQ